MNTFLSLILVLSLTATSLFAKDELPRRAYFGAKVEAASDSLHKASAIPFEGGLHVMSFTAGSSAAAAGIQVNDILLTVAGTSLSDALGLTSTIKAHKPGETIAVQLLRGKDKLTKKVKLLPFPKETSDAYDVLYESIKVDDSLRRIIITKPKPKGKYPVVVFVGGIGCFTFDLPPGTPFVYNTIIGQVAKEGFVTVRIEKSGQGDSQGQPCADVDFNTELRGYLAAMRALSSYDFMDTTRVILLGHSMGGIITPLIAKDYPVKGIIAIATDAGSWFEYELINQRRQLLLAGTGYDTVEIKAREKELALHALLVEKKTPEQILNEHPTFGEDLEYPCHYSYIQQVADLNMAAVWKQVDAQVIFVYGLSDFVTDAAGHKYATDLVNFYHPHHATYVEVPNMDHYFINTPSQKASFENSSQGLPNRDFQQNVMPVILDWSKELVKTEK